MTAATRATHRRLRVRPSPGAAVFALVVTVLLVSSIVPLRTYLDQRGRLTRISSRIEVLASENAGLRRRVRLLHTPEHIERLARRCFGMVKKGEITFIVVPRTGAARPPVC